ncbi:MAG: glycerate kinase, partial [Clostridia bacterium]|nr:glycerate kinase [Clostridia bacterium]
MRILVCPDSYKGSADACSVAAAIARGIADASPGISVRTLPMADGGEGSSRIIADALGAETVHVDVTGPYFERVRASYCISGEVAYIEMAQASGLCLRDRRECEYATTYGTGEMLLDAQRRGVKSIVVFIGGSATCDGGMGMAAALGYRFCSDD